MTDTTAIPSLRHIGVGRSASLRAKHRWLFTFLILLLFGWGSFAQETELAVGKVQHGTVGGGKSQFFAVSLNAGDFAQIHLDPCGKRLVLIIHDPSGGKFRGTAFGPDKVSLPPFAADGPGTYRIEVAASNKTSEGAFTITLEKVVPLTALMAPPKPAHESPRIKLLRASVE